MCGAHSLPRPVESHGGKSDKKADGAPSSLFWIGSARSTLRRPHAQPQTQRVPAPRSGRSAPLAIQCWGHRLHARRRVAHHGCCSTVGSRPARLAGRRFCVYRVREFSVVVVGALFARFIWPRIEPPTGLEDARPARFAQFFGFVFTALALIFFVVGIDVPDGLTALAFGVSALNASTGLCVGCKVYLLIRRPPPTPSGRRGTAFREGRPARGRPRRRSAQLEAPASRRAGVRA